MSGHGRLGLIPILLITLLVAAACGGHAGDSLVGKWQQFHLPGEQYDPHEQWQLDFSSTGILTATNGEVWFVEHYEITDGKLVLRDGFGEMTLGANTLKIQMTSGILVLTTPDGYTRRFTRAE